MPFNSKRKSVLAFFKKIKSRIKEKIIFKIKKNSENSSLIVDKLNSNQLRFKWNIDTYSTERIVNPDIYCLGLRVYDITSAKSKDTSTCIMKEIEVNKYLSEYLYHTHLDNGLYLIEVGYRSPNGKWSMLCSSKFNLGKRSQTNITYDDSWFYPSESKESMPKSLHERLYRLSKTFKSGGSELIHR
tara:strand:+ start:526 stop:1083 length:558 start_codon:yes stop_codon:yes gene_type:complete